MILKINFITVLIIGIFLPSNSICADLSANETTTALADAYVNKVNRQMFHLYEELHRLIFNKYPYEYVYKIIDDIANLTKESQNYPLYTITNDNGLKLALENIRRSAYLYILGGKDYGELSTLIDKMLSPSLNKRNCPLDSNKEECKLSYIGDMENMIANNDYDVSHLLHFQTIWRQGENSTKVLLTRFIELFKLAANQTGVTPIEFLYNYYGGDTSIIDNMQEVMRDLKQFHKEFHAYVRYQLNKKYGDAEVPLDAPIPYHIFQVAVLQAWKKNSVIRQPYPKFRLPNLKAGLEGINGQLLINGVEYFYQSIGFDYLPQNIKSNFKKKRENNMGIHCKAEIYDQTPNIRMEYCPGANIKRYIQTHGYLGRIHYAYEKRNLPFQFFPSYKFEDAVSEAVVLCASSPKHLMGDDIVLNFTYPEELEMNRLFRMGIHTILSIPTYYVHIKLFEDILSGATTLEEMNAHYWKVMEEYAGVEAMNNRHANDIDLPYKFYEDLKANRLATKFVSEILGYQIYELICTYIGEYNEIKPLHDCSLQGRKGVGNILKPMMKSGSKKPWKETLQIITGDLKGISGKGVLNYYAPLRKWIQTKLVNKSIPVGWNSSKKDLKLPS